MLRRPIPGDQAGSVSFRQLSHEKELVCDELTIGSTHRPLALSSALAKVWQHTANGARYVQFGAEQQVIGEVVLAEFSSRTGLMRF